MSVGVLMMLAVTAGIVLAQPANDSSGTTTVIGSLPFADTLDTTTATSDPADPSLYCGPLTNTVWYTFNAGPTGNPHVILSTLASDYTAVMYVSATSPAGALAGCGYGEISFAAAPSTTYYIMIGDCCGSGGTLQFSARQGLSFGGTVNPIGSVDARTGMATVSGTYSCNLASTVDTVELFLAQPVGRFIVNGQGALFPSEACSPGISYPWTLQVRSLNGKFGGGRATARLEVSGEAGTWISSFGPFPMSLRK
jgi:hypothetical protein